MTEGDELTSEQMYDNEDTFDPTQIGRSWGDKTTFNHQHLVMVAYLKAVENGGKEMKKGYWETKLDKFGNKLQTYHPDTRHEFINSVKMLYLLTTNDLEENFKEEIKAILRTLNQRKTVLMQQEESYYNNLGVQDKLATPHVAGFLNQELPFYQVYVQSELEASYFIMEIVERGLGYNKYFKIAPAQIRSTRSVNDAVSES